MLRCHRQNDFCIKMGSGVSHFTVSLVVKGEVAKTVSVNHNLENSAHKGANYRSKYVTQVPWNSKDLSRLR